VSGTDGPFQPVLLSSLPSTWAGPTGLAPTQGAVEVRWYHDGISEPLTLYLRWRDWGDRATTIWEGYVIRAPIEPSWQHLHAPWSPNLLRASSSLGDHWLRALGVLIPPSPDEDPMGLLRRLHHAAESWLQHGWPAEAD